MKYAESRFFFVASRVLAKIRYAFKGEGQGFVPVSSQNEIIKDQKREELLKSTSVRE